MEAACHSSKEVAVSTGSSASNGDTPADEETEARTADASTADAAGTADDEDAAATLAARACAATSAFTSTGVARRTLGTSWATCPRLDLVVLDEDCTPAAPAPLAAVVGALAPLPDVGTRPPSMEISIEVFAPPGSAATPFVEAELVTPVASASSLTSPTRTSSFTQLHMMSYRADLPGGPTWALMSALQTRAGEMTTRRILLRVGGEVVKAVEMEVAGRMSVHAASANRSTITGCMLKSRATPFRMHGR